MAEEEDECHRRFQTAVSVVQSLPKHGPYRPSYDAMLRFYGYYKQATCGPCTFGRPPFWDPVGRYKWDAWKRLGDMSRVAAMAAYVEEIKVVSQEVINTLPLTEGTASLFHYFEPLYHVIEDMPRPPPEFFRQPGGEHRPPHTSEEGDTVTELEEERGDEEEEGSRPDVIHQSHDLTGSAETTTSGNAATKDLKLHGQAAPDFQEQRGGADTGSSRESGTKQGESCRGPQGSVRHWSLKPAGGAHSPEVDALIARVLKRLQTEMQMTLCRLRALEEHWSAQDSALLGPPRRVGASDGQAPCWRLFLFLLLWPVLSQWLAHVLNNRRIK
uniref:ACB domain-containing protein n=1 Tax=Erpetoichthys calabaricus TaxID=27687 RepID=A0A8C4SLH9_ERPCA